MACPALNQSTGFLSGMLRFMDCQAQSIGGNGYQALAAPGSGFSLILTGLLTLFVAIFGYRMLLGHTPNARDAVLALVKIGIVLVLATSWPAYRTLVYDVALRGPADLAAQIGTPAGLPGASGGIVARLEGADRALVAIAIAGTGQAPTPEQQRMPGAVPVAPPAFGGFDAFALGGARILFLIGVIGAFAVLRLVGGLLLAAAPLFAGFLLFDGTRGLFEGWLRVLGGVALGAFGASIVLGVELALIEPWLSALLNARAVGLAIPNAPVELFVTTLIFCLALVAMLHALARLAMGLRLAPLWHAASTTLLAPVRPGTRTTLASERSNAPNETRSRAAAIVDAVAASQRRETGLSGGSAVANPQPRTASSPSLHTNAIPAAAPLGQSSRRRTGTRSSASAARRDDTP